MSSYDINNKEVLMRNILNTLYFIAKNEKIIFSSFIFLFIGISLGLTARWGLLGQIAMVDQYNLTGNFYPNPLNQMIKGLSLYFPGIPILMSFIVKILPSTYLLEFFHLMAIIFTAGFILRLNSIHNSISQTDNKVTILYFLVLISFLGREWLFYSLELKTDTIAYLWGTFFWFKLVRMEKIKGNVFKAIFFGGAMGLGIVFKQQYISFIIGVFIFSVLNGNSTYIISALSSILISFIIITVIYFNDFAWYWTITISIDDGLMGMNKWLQLNYKFLIKIFAVSYILFVLQRSKLKPIKLILKKIISNIKIDPWFIPLFLASGASFLGGLKQGGNAGNFSLSIILLSPYLVYFFNDINKKYLIIWVWIGFILFLPFTIQGLDKYKTDLLLREKAILYIPTEAKYILTGSNVYNSVRPFLHSAIINNYWIKKLKDNNFTCSNDIFKDLLSSQKFDYFLVENECGNKDTRFELYSYKILFVNNLGIIGKKIN